jgi:hypothetical protein
MDNTTTLTPYEGKFADFKKKLFVSIQPGGKLLENFLDVPFDAETQGMGDRLLTPGEAEAYDLLNKIDTAFAELEDLLATKAEQKEWRK